MDKRPILNKKISIKDFQAFYWLKNELVIFCREVEIPVFGKKKDLISRIEEYIKTGKVINKIVKKSKRQKLPKSTHPITQDTFIGVEYRSYKEKKDFLQSVTGKNFHFTTHLLVWFKKNSGKKTYGDFISEWYKEKKLKKDPNYNKKIAPQFEYNTYIRDFLKDNSGKKIDEAIKHWKIKRSVRGNNIYCKSDLEN